MGVFVKSVSVDMSTESQPSNPAPSSNTEVDQANEDKTNLIDPRKVYVGNLAFKTRFKGIKEAFSPVGEIDKIHLVYKNGRRLGFAFVQFTTEEAAQAAIEKMNATELDGREIKVEVSRVQNRTRKPKSAAAPKTENKKAEPKQKNAKKVSPPAKKLVRKVVRRRVPVEDREDSEDTIFVRGFGSSADKDSITELFKDFGVTSVTLKRSFQYRAKERISSRFAFVTVDSPANQEKAVASLNGKEIDGNTIEVRKAFKALPTEIIEVEETRNPRRNNRKKSAAKESGENTVTAESTGDSVDGKSPSTGSAKPKRKRPRKPKQKTEKKTENEGDSPVPASKEESAE